MIQKDMTIFQKDYFCGDILGNAFVLIDQRHLPSPTFTANDVKFIAQSGASFDQLLCLQAPMTHNCLASLRIFNVDGSIAAHCGNGLLYIAQHLHQRGLFDTHCTINLMNRKVTVGYTHAYYYVDFDLPRIVGALTAEQLQSIKQRYPDLSTAALIDVGNVHMVLSSYSPLDLQWIVGQLPGSADWNVHHMQAIDTCTIRIHSYERGCGPTLACGSGSVATAFVHSQSSQSTQRITVQQARGLCYVDPAPDQFKLLLPAPPPHSYKKCH